jgi:hypothetical protein
MPGGAPAHKPSAFMRRRTPDTTLRTYRTESGAEMPIQRMAVDSGFATMDVYAWARRQAPGKVMVIKGPDHRTGRSPAGRAVLSATRRAAGVASTSATTIYWRRAASMPRRSCSARSRISVRFGRLCLMALIQTPHRFRTKKQLWAYSGLGLERHGSGEYHYVQDQLQRSTKPVGGEFIKSRGNRRLVQPATVLLPTIRSKAYRRRRSARNLAG